MFFLYLAATALVVAAVDPAKPSRQVHWYVSEGNTVGNAAFLAAHGAAATGGLLCCGFGGFNATGGWAMRAPVATYLTYADVFTSTGRDAWAVVGVAEAAVHSGAWRAGLPAATAASAALAAGGLAGFIVDYEPEANYTMAHAQAYGEFLGALAAAAAPLKVGMDIAGWGVLKAEFWPAFLGRGLARFTSMTPTYDATNVTADEVFVTQVRGLPPASR